MKRSPHLSRSLQKKLKKQINKFLVLKSPRYFCRGDFIWRGIASAILWRMHERFYTSPKPIPEDIELDTPLVFLAGPVQGAPDWQARFAATILRERPKSIVVSPRPKTAIDANFDADEQVAWEITHRARAREFGVTAIWFAAQDFSIPYPAGRPYAQTSRIELGETIGWLRAHPNLAFTVGFDPQYTNNGGGSESYIRKLLSYHQRTVHGSEDTFIASIIENIPHD